MQRRHPACGRKPHGRAIVPHGPILSREAASKGWHNHGQQKDFLDRIGAQRRKTASGSPKGERSESIDKINKIQLSDSHQGRGGVQARSNAY